jgi:hypothetical protein
VQRQPIACCPLSANRVSAAFPPREREHSWKQQIPIRTFQEWNEARPGFLEADLVAHCGTDIEGGYLYTLTLTDVATGWTECRPLLYRSQETVLAALQRARTLFPFPILGIDTDNGGEFINEVLITYCEQEHISFTRGRPYLKNDQCFVEQKNGAIVRQVVGYDRLAGELSYRQLAELYRALRLYVNCFQPSMKLQSKQRDGKNVRRVYDAAKTPLQRLLLSGALPAQKQQELIEVAHALDPIRLLHQLEQLQQAVFRCAVGYSPFLSSPLSDSLHVFSVEQCTAGKLPAERGASAPRARLPTGCATSFQQTGGVVRSSFTGHLDYIACFLARVETLCIRTGSTNAINEGPEALHLMSTFRCATHGLRKAPGSIPSNPNGCMPSATSSSRTAC